MRCALRQGTGSHASSLSERIQVFRVWQKKIQHMKSCCSCCTGEVVMCFWVFELKTKTDKKTKQTKQFLESSQKVKKSGEKENDCGERTGAVVNNLDLIWRRIKKHNVINGQEAPEIGQMSVTTKHLPPKSPSITHLCNPPQSVAAPGC